MHDEDIIDDPADMKIIDYFALMNEEDEDPFNSPYIINSTPSPVKAEDDFLFKRFLPTEQHSAKGIEAVESFEVSELAEAAGIHGDNETVEAFLTSLKNSYILMVKSIMERYDEKAYNSPRNYPEFEIYDSVHGIIEGDELEELTNAFSEDSGASVFGVSESVYKALDELFCGISKWNEAAQGASRDAPSLY